MPLRTRRLDRDEWPTVLAGTPLGVAAPHLGHDGVLVIVVEDDDGALVGCWSLVNMWHAEGLWIAPAQRTKVAVGRHLLAELKAVAKALDAPVILTGAEETDRMTQRLLEHVGATPMPITLYRWPILTDEVNH